MMNIKNFYTIFTLICIPKLYVKDHNLLYLIYMFTFIVFKFSQKISPIFHFILSYSVILINIRSKLFINSFYFFYICSFNNILLLLEFSIKKLFFIIFVL